MSRLANAKTNLFSQNPAHLELNALFIYNVMLVIINKDLAWCLVESYSNNPWWVRILSQLDFNNALGVNKALLPFIQELSSIEANFYFLLRLMTAINNHNNKVISPSIFDFKLIYHINYISDVYHLYILISIALEIIIIVYGKDYPDFT